MIRVIGVGDTFVDRYIYQNIMYPGGNSINFAIYSRMLGHESSFLGSVAEDREAKMIMAALDAYGVDHSKCVVASDGETGRGSIYLNDGDRVITDDNNNGTVKSHPLQITEEVLEYVKGFDLIHTSYFAFMEDRIEKLASAGVPIVYDFADDWNEDTLKRICPYIQIALLSGGEMTDDELKEYMEKSYGCGCAVTVCTIGSRGALVYDGEEFYTKMPYNKGKKIVDTMGAGDSFITGFSTTYIDGMKRLKGLIGEDEKKYTNQEDRDAYRKAVIDMSMHVGNSMAMRTCMSSGSFGRSEAIE